MTPERSPAPTKDAGSWHGAASVKTQTVKALSFLAAPPLALPAGWLGLPPGCVGTARPATPAPIELPPKRLAVKSTPHPNWRICTAPLSRLTWVTGRQGKGCPLSILTNHAQVQCHSIPFGCFLINFLSNLSLIHTVSCYIVSRNCSIFMRIHCTVPFRHKMESDVRYSFQIPK